MWSLLNLDFKLNFNTTAMNFLPLVCSQVEVLEVPNHESIETHHVKQLHLDGKGP